LLDAIYDLVKMIKLNKL